MESLITVNLVFFCLAVFAATHTVRKVIEALLPTIRKDTPLTRAQKVWEEFLLPSLPILVGIGLAVLVKSWPWPPGIVTASSRAIAGGVAGFISTWVYRMLKSFLTKKYEVDLDAPMQQPSMAMLPKQDAPKPPPVA